ncbi:MAG: hypothetical protein JST92_03895 [Deltaproteobacteria bacterium]|nr:hypothetical protein [Deltaproteobacteria bacterium]
MRTTVDLPPSLLRRLRAEALDKGVPFKDYLSQVLERGLEGPRAKGVRGKLPSASLGEVRAGVDLDRALALVDGLETEAFLSKRTGA